MCVIEDCYRMVTTKGYCRMHYDRLRKYGTPLPGHYTFKDQPATQSLLQDIKQTLLEAR